MQQWISHKILCECLKSTRRKLEKYKPIQNITTDVLEETILGNNLHHQREGQVYINIQE